MMRADHARAAVEGGEPRGHASEERERVDGEREQQPAEEADAEDAQNDADDDHGGYLRDKGSNGRAFHHHHGASQSIAEDDRWRQRKSGLDLRAVGVTVAPSGLEGVELVDDGGRIAVIFGGRQDAEFAVAGLEDR